MICIEFKGARKNSNTPTYYSFLAQWLAVEGISKTSSLSQGI